LTQKLGSLYRTLNARQEAMPKLMRLSGRLDMVSSQMDVFPLEDHEEDNAVVFDANEEEDEKASESEVDDVCI
jgi:hypothetical protein